MGICEEEVSGMCMSVPCCLQMLIPTITTLFT